MSEQEKKNEKIGMAVSVGLHAIVLLIFFFILAWRAPDPPLPEYGIELNFGMDDAGYGDEQPETPASQSQAEEPQPESTPEPVQEVQEQQPVAEAEPQEPEVEEAADEVVTQPEPSPVTTEDVKKPEPKPEPVKETPKPEPVEEAPEEEAEEETANPSALFPSDNATSESADANQGDREGEVGDQGNEEGSIDSRALYGEQGGGQSGASLSIAGWRWDEAPNKQDQSAENGKIVFSFEIDDQGYVTKVVPRESTVSPKVTQFYREQLLSTTFSPTSDNAIPAPRTTGTVTFIIKAR